MKHLIHLNKARTQNELIIFFYNFNFFIISFKFLKFQIFKIFYQVSKIILLDILIFQIAKRILETLHLLFENSETCFFEAKQQFFLFFYSKINHINVMSMGTPMSAMRLPPLRDSDVFYCTETPRTYNGARSAYTFSSVMSDSNLNENLYLCQLKIFNDIDRDH